MLKMMSLIFILTLISSKEMTSNLEYGVDIPFKIDRFYSKINFNYEGSLEDPIIIYAEPDYDDFVFTYNPKSAIYYTTKTMSKKGNGLIVKAGSNDIGIEVHYLNRTTGTGKFWINPSKNELKIDLSKKYGKMIPIYSNYINAENAITYDITNLKRDYTIIFKYQKEMKINYTYYNISNPFVVCRKNECKENITIYNFTKGESYKIIIKFEPIEDSGRNYIILAGYTFYEN